VNEDGELISPEDSEYIWLGPLLGHRKLSGVAPSSDAALVNANDPNATMARLLVALKEAVGNNFVAAFMMFGAGAIGMHYESILRKYGMCPTPTAIGLKNTGKSTAARTVLAALGVPQFFLRDFTATAPAVINSQKTFPTVFDDPTDLTKVKSLIDDTFNRGGRQTTKTTTISRSLGIITINLDRMRQLCSNYK
jgi:hypothetical protein